MHRPIIYADEQGRSYDFLTGFREALAGFGLSLADLFGSGDTVVSGLAASASSGLTISVAAGRIYRQTTLDATAYGTVGTDSRTIVQQGTADAQTLTFVTSGMSSGQSQYALVQATFKQVDAIPSDDPNSGILQYYNADDPANSLEGPSGSGTPQSTRREGVCTLSIKYGTAATTGSETAPSADSGCVPLYLIDLTYGQTAITSAQIVTHSLAPFLAGLLASHHNGAAGQAPKIDLTKEVQNVLPLSNTPSIPMSKLSAASSANAGGGVSTTYVYAGNPNGYLAGTSGAAGTSPPDTCWDKTNSILYICTTTGTTATAVWTAINPALVGGVATFGDGTVGSQSSVTAPAWLGGEIRKYGISAAHTQSSGAFTVNFTDDFPTKCVHASCGIINPSAGISGSYEVFGHVVSWTTTGVTLMVKDSGSGTTALPLWWEAKGY